MRTLCGVRVFSVAALLACGAVAHGQAFPSLNGLDFSLTGSASVDVSVGPLPELGTTYSYDQTFVLVKGSLPPNTSSTSYYEAPSFVASATGSPTENVTASYNLGSVNINGTVNQLPAVQLTGTFDRNTGAFAGTVSAPATVLNFSAEVTPAGGGSQVDVPFTVDVNSASLNLAGQAVSTPEAFTISGAEVGAPNYNITAFATVTDPATGLPTTVPVPYTVNSAAVTSFVATAVPEPSGLAFLVPAALGSVVMLRRRRAR